MTAPAHTLPVSLPREVEIHVKSVALSFLDLGGRVAGLACCMLRGEVAVAVTSHVPPLPMCGLDAPGRGLLTAARTAE